MQCAGEEAHAYPGSTQTVNTCSLTAAATTPHTDILKTSTLHTTIPHATPSPPAVPTGPRVTSPHTSSPHAPVSSHPWPALKALTVAAVSR